MQDIADYLALAALVALSALFVAAFFDEVDPDWDSRGLKQRVLAMPVLTGLILAVWLLTVIGGATWPGLLVGWLAGALTGFVATLAAVVGLVAALAGIGWVIWNSRAAHGATLPRHVATSQLGYAALLLGVGVTQAAVGSH